MKADTGSREAPEAQLQQPLCSGPRPGVASPLSACPFLQRLALPRPRCPSAASLACCLHSLLPVLLSCGRGRGHRGKTTATLLA